MMELTNNVLKGILTGVKSRYLATIGTQGPFIDNLPSFENVAKVVSKKLHSKKISGATLYSTYHQRTQEEGWKKYNYHLNIINALCIYAFEKPFEEYISTINMQSERVHNDIFTYPVTHYSKVDFDKILTGTSQQEQALRRALSNFKNVYLKNESGPVLPTGFFQDREASDIIVHMQYLRAKSVNGPIIKQFSALNRCSLAYSIQAMMNERNMGALRVLCDDNDVVAFQKLKQVGCLPFFNQSKKKLSELELHEILNMTENFEGYSIHDKEAFPDDIYTSKNWLYDELLSINADGIFIPVKSGEIFKGLINRLQELENQPGICTARNINLEKANTAWLFGVTEQALCDISAIQTQFGQLRNNFKIIYGGSNHREIPAVVFKYFNIEEPGDVSLKTLGRFIQMASEGSLSPEKKYLILNIGKTNAPVSDNKGLISVSTQKTTQAMQYADASF